MDKDYYDSIFESLFLSRDTRKNLNKLNDISVNLFSYMTNCEIIIEKHEDEKYFFHFNSLKEAIKQIMPQLKILKCSLSSGYMGICFLVNDLFCFKKQIRNEKYYNLDSKIKLLHLIKDNVDIEIPELNILDDFVYYKVIEGFCYGCWEQNIINRYNLVQQLANFLAQLHSIDYKKYNISMNKDDSFYNIHVLKNKDFFERNYNLMLKILNGEEKENFIKEYQEYVKEINNNENNVITHNDLFNNLILDDEYDLKGVIDFESLNIANYNFEFAHNYCDFNRDFIKSVIKEYEFLSGRKINILFLDFVANADFYVDKFNKYCENFYNELFKGGKWQRYQTYTQLNFTTSQRNSDWRLSQYKLYDYLKSTDEVLDIGCNSGFIDLTIADKVKSVLGLEYENDLIVIANKVKDFMEIKNVEFQQVDFNKFNITRRFDFIFSFAVHYWIGMDLDKYEEKICNLLKEKGMVIFETQSINDINLDYNYDEKIQKFIGNRFKIVREKFLMNEGKDTDRKYWILEKI